MTQLPNIISTLRIAGSVGLLLCDVTDVVLAMPSSVTTRPSPSELGRLSLLRPFWIIYVLCGISDIADGWLARRLKCVTKTGALLDSLADICFVACCVWKLLPILELPLWLWLWAGVIVGNGIPALHRSPHDIFVYHPLHYCGRYRYICRHSRGALYKNVSSLVPAIIAWCYWPGVMRTC